MKTRPITCWRPARGRPLPPTRGVCTLAGQRLDTGAPRCEECGTGSTRHTRRAHPRRLCALPAVAGLGPRRPRRADKSRLCALPAVAGLGPRRPRRACKEKKMRTWSLLALALSGLLVAGELSSADAADKDTLGIALDTLGAQVMDPIMDTRAPHAHYHAPIWDSLVGFDLEKGGIGPGVAERWELAADGRSWTFYLRKGQRFHNGDPVTAHDVKFSLERIMLPESISSGAAALRRAVDRIEVVDDLTVGVYPKGAIPQFARSLPRAVFME